LPGAIVSVQNPVVLSDDTEPQPDVQLLRRRPVPYKERKAFSEHTPLLIEVTETSLRYDRSTKLRLYAEARIAEYWIVDCAAEAVEIHRSPHAHGYRDVVCVTEAGATVRPQAFPDVTVTLAEIFA
jgi:Uma2 family endonuclease